ncbi:MAG: tetratricopeptide repeat protein [Chloroflexi bacterium]|nr:tetratricopeptide repeat protein [Chloroflexota bacterium]
MMDFTAYIPEDRRQALARQELLPNQTSGAALFADISGFTPLTERLAKLLGVRRGAEELSHHLNEVYDELIAQVHYFGGSVIGFAGDAITCWFDDQNGPASAHALATALAMQTVMAAFKHLALPDGTAVQLEMKAVVTTGPAHRFLVGDPDIQLIDVLAGNTIDRLAQAENLAQPGEILADEATVTVLNSCVTIMVWRQDEQDTSFAVIRDVDTVVAPQQRPTLPPHSLSPEQTHQWLHNSVYEREQIGQGQFLTELRPAVALFMRFTGLNYEGDTAVANHLNHLVQQTQQTVARYEGTLLQLTIGDKGSYIYASFGAPIAHEDDAHRAAAAALELHNLAEQLKIPPMQIGISRGIMRAGSYGAASRRTYGVLGDHVNLAARLMSQAGPGQTLVSQPLHKLLQRNFYLKAMPAVSLKGKSGLIPIYSLNRRIRPQTGFLQEPIYPLPMVGRVEELQLIRQHLDDVLDGRGQVIGITAEAGLGKSRMVAEVIKLVRARNLYNYSGECQSYGSNIPYLVWLPIWYRFFNLDSSDPSSAQAQQLVAEIERLAPERLNGLPLLGAMLGLPIPENEFTQTLEPQSRRSALEALLIDCLEAKARRAQTAGSALVFVIEDLHWIGPASHDLLENIARRVVGLPVCLILAYRPPEMVRLQKPRLEALGHFTAVPLTELSATNTETLARTRLQHLFQAHNGRIPGSLIKQIIARAQGNPFYVEELVNFLHDRQLDFSNPDALSDLELPSSLHSLILSRIDQLNEQQKLTLKIASIIGRLFRFSWLRGYYPALGHPEHIKLILEELVSLDLTPVDQPEPELVYMFKHIVTQEVTYESLPYATRAVLHEQLAQFLEALDHNQYVDLLAYHYERSENIPKKREYLQRAGETAVARFANEEAAGYFSRALALTPDNDYTSCFTLLLHREQLLDLQGERERQNQDLQALSRLSRKLMDAGKEAEVALRQARYAEVTGDYQAAAAAAQQALAMSRVARQIEREAAAYLQWGRALFRQADYDFARRCLQHAHTLAQKNNLSDLEADCLMNLGNVAWSQGAYEEANGRYEQARQLKSAAGDKRGESILLNNLGVVSLSQTDYDTAQHYYERALRIMQAIGDRRNESFVLGNLGLVAAHKGEFSQAQIYQKQSLRLRREVSDRYGEYLALLNLGTIALYEGNFATAQTYYELALTQYRETNNVQGEAEVLVYLALLQRKMGEFAKAYQLSQEALQITQKLGLRPEEMLAWKNAGQALVELEDWKGAVVAFEKSVAICGDIGNENMAQEALAGLLVVAMHQGDREGGARSLTGTIVAHLQQGNLHGTDEPLLLYLRCYRALRWLDDDRAAAVLQAGVNLLQTRANNIYDDESRQMYLALPEHQAIMQAAAGN